MGRGGLYFGAALVVALAGLMVVSGREEAFADLESDDSSINELSDVGTSDDMQAFDNAYDNTLVDKVVDKDFDPDKMFADMERLGEDRAKKLAADAAPKEPQGLPDVHFADVEQASQELQGAAQMAESIAQHPSRFHKLAHTDDSMNYLLGESADESKGAKMLDDSSDIKVEAEAKLKAAETAVHEYGVKRAEAKAAANDAGAEPSLKRTGANKIPPVSKTAPTTDAPKSKGDDKAAKSSDPVGGKAAPDAADRGDSKSKHDAKTKEENEQQNRKDDAHKPAAKAAGDPLAGSAAKESSKVPASSTSEKTDTKHEPAEDTPSKAPPQHKEGTAKKDEETAKSVPAKDTKDYFVEAAKAMQGGATAKQLLLIAKKAYSQGNRAKAKAYLAAAEEVEAKKEEEDSKPKEHLLDILRRKQGHAVRLNAASVAAQQAINTMAHTKFDTKGPQKKPAVETVSVTKAHSVSTTSPLNDADKEERDAEKALLATQKAARIAIAKAKARVAAVKARRGAKHAPFHKLKDHVKDAGSSLLEQHDDGKTIRVQKDAMKLKKGELKNAPGPGGKDAFGFSSNDRRSRGEADKQADKEDKKKAEEKEKEKKEAASKTGDDKKDSPDAKKENEPAKPKHSEESKDAKDASKAESFGFGGDKEKESQKSDKNKDSSKAQSEPHKHVELGESASVKVLDRATVEHDAMEASDDLHVWVNGKPIDVNAMKAKAAKQAQMARNKSSEKSEKNRLQQLRPEKEVATKKQASSVADDMHIWVNGQPVVTKAAKKAKDVVVVPTLVTKGPEEAPKDVVAKKTVSARKDLGEAEGLTEMRKMKLVATHVQDSSKSMDEQNQFSPDSEYNFSIRNTDEKHQSLGLAKNIHLDVKLPKSAQLKDAYFYLEAEGKDDPQSKNCKINTDAGDGPSVNCEVPSVKNLVDVYIRAHFDGDQKVLSQLTSSMVDGTLHEGHEVLTSSQIAAVKKMPLLKRMPHD